MTSKKTLPKKGLIKRLLAMDSDEKHLEAPDGKFFVLSNGGTLKTVNDLISALKKMPVEEFNHHTKEGRNDFANWLWFVFDEKACADKIFKAKDVKETIKILEKHFS